MLKKYLIYSLSVIFLIIILYGCKNENFSENKNVNTISMLANIDITAPGGKVFRNILDAFKKKNPELTVNVDYSFGEPFFQKMASLAASGDLPDCIYMFPGGRSSNLMENGLVQDLYPFIENDSIKERLISAALKPQYKGKLYEIPYTITTTHVFYVNKGLLEKHNLTIPKTYAELKEISAKLRAKGIEPVVMGNKDSWVNQSCLFSMIVGRLAGDKWLRSAIKGDSKFTDDIFVEALKFFQKIFKDKVISASSVQVSYGEVPNLFASEKAAFLIDGDWRVNVLNPLIKGDKQENIILTIFPEIPGEKYKKTTSKVVGIGYGMNANLKGKKAQNAWKWCKFYSDTEAATIRLKEQGLVPSVKNVDLSKFKLSTMIKRRLAFNKAYRGTMVLDDALSAEPIQVLNSGLQKLAMGSITPERLAAQFENAVRKKYK